MDNELKDMLVKILEGQEGLKLEVGGLSRKVDNLEGKVDKLENRMMKVEFKLEEIDNKVQLSLEGHKTNTEQLNRIENRVSKNEEFILRRVK